MEQLNEFACATEMCLKLWLVLFRESILDGHMKSLIGQLVRAFQVAPIVLKFTQNKKYNCLNVCVCYNQKPFERLLFNSNKKNNLQHKANVDIKYKLY